MMPAAQLHEKPLYFTETKGAFERLHVNYFERKNQSLAHWQSVTTYWSLDLFSWAHADFSVYVFSYLGKQ